MGRSLIWLEGDANGGWACSSCRWRFPVPTLLSSKEAKEAYDRLASSKFDEHRCEEQVAPPIAKPQTGPTIAERARRLIVRGCKPKDAVEIVLQDIALECRNDARVMELARGEAEDFLMKVRKGLI